MKDFLTLKGGEVEISGAPEIISVLPLGHVTSAKGDFNVDECQRRCDFVIFRRTGTVRKWRVEVCSL